MPFLVSSEMTTHLYQETMDDISRSDTTKMDTAINEAIAEARGYINPRYDDVATFAQTGDGRNPILLLYVKDIAVWHFITLCNSNVEIELRRDRYRRAIEWLKEIQSGKTNPALPLPNPDADGNQPNTGIQSSSNTPRNNQF